MQSQLKVLAPVITRDVTIPNTSEKVPMVVVHVPDSKTMMAIPLSTLSQMSSAATAASSSTTTTTTTLAAASSSSSSSAFLKDEQQAKDLLNWTDGVGTLDGCDLRFKINQLGCLELLDSDDEANLEHLASKQRPCPTQPLPPQPYLQQQQHCQDQDAPIQVQDNQQRVNTSSSATSSNNTSGSSSSSSSTTITNGLSSAPGSSGKRTSNTKQISPGSSLLRDGPDNRRSRASSSSATTPTPSQTNAISNSSSSSNNNNSNDNTSNKVNSSTSMPLSKRFESNHQTLLLEKLIPKKRLDEIKAVVESWSVEDVRNFVDSIPGCSGNGHLFESQQICGKSLMYLDQKDLVEIIHVKLGPAIKIYNAISMIKPQEQ